MDERRVEVEDAYRSAHEDALDEIAALCGCPTWEYPGQVVRDVQQLRGLVEAAAFICSQSEEPSWHGWLAQAEKLLGRFADDDTTDGTDGG